MKEVCAFLTGQIQGVRASGDFAVKSKEDNFICDILSINTEENSIK